jgi:biotin operon repressor
VLTSLGFTLLRQLGDGAFHSGEDLAANVGLTRARVSQLLKEAETAGLALERIRGRGYRLLATPDFLAADQVRAALSEIVRKNPQVPLVAIEVVDEIASTSTELLRRAQRKDIHGTVLAAEWQTAGRGRRGRKWTAVAARRLSTAIACSRASWPSWLPRSRPTRTRAFLPLPLNGNDAMPIRASRSGCCCLTASTSTALSRA